MSWTGGTQNAPTNTHAFRAQLYAPPGWPAGSHTCSLHPAPAHCAALTEAKLHALHWVALPGVTTNLPAGCSRGAQHARISAAR